MVVRFSSVQKPDTHLGGGRVYGTKPFRGFSSSLLGPTHYVRTLSVGAWQRGASPHGGQETKKERARTRHALQSHVPYELLLQLGSSSQNNATARNCTSHK